MKNKKTNKRKLGAAFALVLLSGIASVSSTFAWWNVVSATRNIKIGVGDRIVLAVTAEAENGANLIPNDVTPIGSQATEIVTKIKLSISGETNLSKLRLQVTEGERTFDGGAYADEGTFDGGAYADYFSVEIEGTEINSSSPVVLAPITEDIEVDIRFTLVVPVTVDRTEALAADLALGTFKITLIFELINPINP